MVHGKRTGDTDKIEGRDGILLIAPHEFPDDDENTGNLTREITEMTKKREGL